MTFRRFVHHGRLIEWSARQNRKGLARMARGLEHTALPFWQTVAYNRAVGLGFALGAALFLLGSLLSLWPGAPALFASRIGLIFFWGSIPFTLAACMQHFQSANAPAFALMLTPGSPAPKIRLIGWQPRSPGWISTLAQLIGTLAFNLNTYDGLRASGDWRWQDRWIWAPDMIGSLLFLISGYLAMLETCHAYWRWRPHELGWRIAFINLLGCMFFMTAAVFAYVPSVASPGWFAVIANIHLALGASCFLLGGLLLVQESSLADRPLV